MRAVNLIPEDHRRGGPGAGSSGGIGGYVLIGVLALAVIMVSAYTLTTHSLSTKRDTVASLERQAQDTEARAGNLTAYSQFTALRQKRVDTIRSLATTRFDWAHSLHELARVLPGDAWLSSVRATVNPTVSVDGGTTDPLRSAINTPAIELIGCTKTHDDVARVIADLRRMDGVQRVSLSSSAKNDTATSSNAVSDSAGTANLGDCTQGNAHYPKFSLTVFFAAPGAAPAATGATTSAGGTQ
jgi:Tfp pilus assembly protein PilN